MNKKIQTIKLLKRLRNLITPKSSEKDQTNFGQQGEELVAQWLTKNGFRVHQKNYRKRCGEIDLIAIKGEVIAFVEVKARNSHYFNLSEVITFSKKQKIILTAKDFLSHNNFENKICRFDVAFVELKNGKYEVEYIANAFNDDLCY